MVYLKQIIEEIKQILGDYERFKIIYEILSGPRSCGKPEEIAKMNQLINKIKNLISKNCGIESEYYKLLENNSPKQGRDYLNLCISTIKKYYESLKNISIFVVHGRNIGIKTAMFEFLKAIGLYPIEWGEAVNMTRKPNPYIEEILIEAFNNAQAILVIFTPDDLVKLNPRFQKKNDPPYEKELTGQARPNVLFEAGLGYGRDPNRTVLVQIGELRPFSDIAGRHIIRFKGTPEGRKKLASRLESAGCVVNLEGTDWLNVGDFTLVDNE